MRSDSHEDGANQEDETTSLESPFAANLLSNCHAEVSKSLADHRSRHARR